jgi:hypothetical protein
MCKGTIIRHFDRAPCGGLTAAATVASARGGASLLAAVPDADERFRLGRLDE